jgi:hypothetical protein
VKIHAEAPRERGLFRRPRRRRALDRYLLQASGDACLMGTMLPQVFLNKINFPMEIKGLFGFAPAIRTNPTRRI